MPTRKILIFGNSGSGKSTLAQQLAETNRLSHLDLDSLAWHRTDPPKRKELSISSIELDDFIDNNQGWIIEGAYTDLLELAEPHSTEIIFLDLPVDTCVRNARNRPWESHKYKSKDIQDENLEMLLDWIRNYPTRGDVLSRLAHTEFYESYDRKKQRATDTQHSIS